MQMVSENIQILFKREANSYFPQTELFFEQEVRLH